MSTDIFALPNFTVDEDGLIENDQLVTVVVSASGGSGGSTTAVASLQVNRSDESTPVARPVQVLVKARDTTSFSTSLNANVVFTTATSGTIVATDTGWALVETDSVGAFACTATNASDETVHFVAVSAEGCSDPTDGALVLGSNIASLTWSA